MPHTSLEKNFPLRLAATSFYANVSGVKLLLEGNRLFGVGVTFSRREEKKTIRKDGKKREENKHLSFQPRVSHHSHC